MAITSRDAIMHLISQAVKGVGKGAGALGKAGAAGLGMAEKGVAGGAPKMSALLNSLKMKAEAHPKSTGALMAGAGAAGLGSLASSNEDEEEPDDEYLELLSKLEQKQQQMQQRKMNSGF